MMGAENAGIEVLQLMTKAMEALDDARTRVAEWIAQKDGVSHFGQPGSSDGSSYDRRPPSARKDVSSVNANGESKAARVNEIVNLIRSSELAEIIESRILDNENRVNRVLLPLYIVHKHFNNDLALSAREIADVTRLLGTPVLQENVSKTLRESAARFISIEGNGSPKRFKLIRRGVQHMEGLLSGRTESDPE
jgi:hypothetical protein